MMDEKRYQRHLEKAKEWRLQTLKQKTAQAMQKAIRAEAAAQVGFVRCVVDGSVQVLGSPKGKCRCVTCGVLKPYKGSKLLGEDGIDAGHFLASRRNSILFDERGIHPQCTHCNRTGGRPEAYLHFMLSEYCQEVIDELERKKNQDSVKFTREELVRMRIGYLDRIKAAEEAMA